MGKGTKQVAVGAVFAAAAGYVAGILTAPKSGKETRQDIAKGALKAKSEAEKKLKELHKELGDVIAEGKKLAESVSASVKSELEEVISRAVAAKEKVRGVLTAIHEGESEDKDLDAAIKEVTKSLTDLRTFIVRNDKKA